MHLYITYKNYSSWSLRPWLLMRVAGIDFQETLLPFKHGDALSDFSKDNALPALVPVLESQGVMIWDSLAIMEYLADAFPEKHLWPQETKLKAIARSAAAEMHSGFMALRSECPMNCRLQRSVTLSEQAQKDVKRLAELWELFECHSPSSKGPFLCGDFSIVDAMFAPVMWRVSGYGLHVSASFDAWSSAIRALPAMEEWYQAAILEEWTVASSDGTE